MKLLVSGCSASSGYGFPKEINDPDSWPMQLSNKLGAELTNVSKAGHNNPAIFLHALKEFTTDHYDIILLQMTEFKRISFSINFHLQTVTGNEGNISNGLVDDKSYATFRKVFTLLNQGWKHWNELMSIIISVQNLVKQGYNIRFINAAIDWEKDFFDNRHSDFSRYIIEYDNLPDDMINEALDKIEEDKKKIDLDLWVGAYPNLFKQHIDNVAEGDIHPGKNSATMYADIIHDYLTKQGLVK